MQVSLVEALGKHESQAGGPGALERSGNSEAVPALSTAAEVLFHRWKGYIHARLWYYYHTVYECPTCISSSVLKTAGYMEHLPQHVLAPKAVKKTCVACLSPTACLHVYPMLTREQLDDEGSAIMVSGLCARHKRGKWDPSSRLYMTEMVAVGTPEYVSVTRDAIAEEIVQAFEAVGISGSFRDADASLCHDVSRRSRSVRRATGQNGEFRVTFGSGSISIVTISDHQDDYGRRFDIKDVNGRPAHSFCAAFSMERLTALGLGMWGNSVSGWPELLRTCASSTALSHPLEPAV